MNTCDYDSIWNKANKRSRLKIKPFWKQVYVASAVWNTGFLQGMAYGMNTVAIPQMQKESIEVSEEMRSWLGSIFGFGSIFWVSILMPAANYFGVKKTFLIVCFSPLLGSTFIFFANSSAQLLCGQAIQSMLQASLYSISTMVMTEHISPNNRSLLLTIKSASLFWGIWLANAIGTFFNWRYIPATSMFCSLYGFTVFLWPECPFWLASKGRLDECASSFRWTREFSEEARAELEKIIDNFSNNNEKKHNNGCKILSKVNLTSICSKEFYIPQFLCFVLSFLYMASGKLACSIYALELLQTMTSDTKSAYLGMLLLDGVNVLGMYCGCYISKKVNRRSLLFIFSGIAIIFLFLSSIYKYLVMFSFAENDFRVSLILLIIFYLAISWGPMIMVVPIKSELTPVNNRLLFCYMMTVISQASFGIFMKIAPFMFKLGIHVAFIFHGCLSSLAILVLFLFLPETSGKTCIEINESFSQSKTKGTESLECKETLMSRKK